MIRAILFDCNGVIADDEGLHFELYQRVLKEEGMAPPVYRDYLEKYLALDDRSCFREFLKIHRGAASDRKVEELIKKKAGYYKEAIQKKLRIFPGVKSFVTKHKKKYELAVVSGALKQEIEWILRRASVRPAFSVIVSTEDVKKSKPDPAPYLHAYKLLNRLPQYRKNPLKRKECLAIEDSIHGVQSAQRAGMKCLAVTNSYPKKDLLHAEFIVKTLEGVQVERLSPHSSSGSG